MTFSALPVATAADWLEAWATVAAAVGTIGTLLYQARALARERASRREDIARLEAERHAASAAQARTILLHDARCDGRPNQFIDTYAVTLGNYGSQTITDVRLRLRSIVDGRETVIDDGPRVMPVLSSDVRTDLAWNLKRRGVVWPAGTDVAELPGLFVIDLEFVDVHGTCWRRRPGADPVRIS